MHDPIKEDIRSSPVIWCVSEGPGINISTRFCPCEHEQDYDELAPDSGNGRTNCFSYGCSTLTPNFPLRSSSTQYVHDSRSHKTNFVCFSSVPSRFNFVTTTRRRLVISQHLSTKYLSTSIINASISPFDEHELVFSE